VSAREEISLCSRLEKMLSVTQQLDDDKLIANLAKQPKVFLTV